MAKSTTAYVCQSCGAKHPKYTGKCTECGEWNTIVEEIVEKNPHTEKLSWKGEIKKKEKARPTLLTNIVSNDNLRLNSQNGELNRVLGGGIVAGSIVLIGGEPGIGKSTLMLQVALMVKGKVLYVSGEESEEQIKMRADRIETVSSDCYIYAETNLTSILLQAANLNPDILVIDSIQTLYASNIESPAGSVSQIRECAGQLQRYAKETNTPVFVIGHINKDGDIAGPKLLEHIVDVVLQFEGDRNYTYRILRTIKNRFGSTAELGIYEMHGSGLREVSNPSELFLSQREEDLSGSTISSFLEGIRPMLIETQALVSKSVYSSPQRSATGFDTRRLGMLLAVLEKRCGFLYSAYDVFLNIAGGIKVNDPAIDLSIVAALISSLQDIAVPADICFAGEIGLSGEIRTVQRIEQRIAEADRLGFKKMFISKYNMKGLESKGYKIQIIPLAKIEDLYNKLFK